MNALEITDLSKEFKGKRNQRVLALDRLSMTLNRGEVFGFLGPNGAGKSTTIKCLMGLIRPTGGDASILGSKIGTVESRRNVGYLPENPSFYDYLTAEEYLMFVGKMFELDNHLLLQRVEDTLKLLELWDARKRPMRGYSKGMIQRVGLAQVMVHDPELYILDEPMSGLDPIGRALVKEIILELRGRGKTVFFSTHITDDVEKVCDRVGIILRGELKSVERLDTILKEGVVGYHIHIKKGGAGNEIMLSSRDGLPKVMAEVASCGDEITLIEPIRKNLEDFFLDIVKNSKPDRDT
ncbi:ABC transporter ATP-binding protein [Geobacter pelophilus]|uniref:ABC transporter ATP-binding protein n=1 Tax=Geoanaerobacter pelophilus TaxID=60036 RepID=A0AAW4L4U1_9BACT|nr:ABC transporter ATP-binding protein [Geoanaerobacter pelophilus]MBT0664550.1 ABC transporter ATP-binding protein [Geoanaerobacter pelophilus]